jgi:hypothetical protein
MENIEFISFADWYSFNRLRLIDEYVEDEEEARLLKLKWDDFMNLKSSKRRELDEIIESLRVIGMHLYSVEIINKKNGYKWKR